MVPSTVIRSPMMVLEPTISRILSNVTHQTFQRPFCHTVYLLKGPSPFFK